MAISGKRDYQTPGTTDVDLVNIHPQESHEYFSVNWLSKKKKKIFHLLPSCQLLWLSHTEFYWSFFFFVCYTVLTANETPSINDVTCVSSPSTFFSSVEIASVSVVIFMFGSGHEAVSLSIRSWFASQNWLDRRCFIDAKSLKKEQKFTLWLLPQFCRLLLALF